MFDSGRRSHIPHLIDTHGARHAHLIGIGGSGMRSMAAVLVERGWRVSGSDVDPGLASETWLARHARLFQGHAYQNVTSDIDVVIYSDAIDPTNVERRHACELGIPTYSYPQWLGRLMRSQDGVVICGTHGKSTTTAMAAEVLTRAGLAPTVVYGGTPIGAPHGARWGQGNLLLAEGCEYRRNFLYLHPQVAVVLGIEPDHFDCYQSSEQLEQAFRTFVGTVRDDGLVLAHSNCEATVRSLANARCRVRTFGVDANADWQADNLRATSGRYQLDLLHSGRLVTRVALRVAGQHQAVNALAAAALAGELGVSSEGIRAGLEAFGGLQRRLEPLGTWAGITVVDDYAHHPTAVRAGLTTIRQMYPKSRVWCVFQPHQISRTERLLDEFAASLQNADKVAVVDVYPAREQGRNDGAQVSRLLADCVRRDGADVLDEQDRQQLLNRLEAELRPGDVLVTIGAGDIRKFCDAFIDRLQRHRRAG